MVEGAGKEGRQLAPGWEVGWEVREGAEGNTRVGEWVGGGCVLASVINRETVNTVR